MAACQSLEDQGREVAKLVVIEPFQRVIFDLRNATLLAQLWIRILVPSPPILIRLHAFCAAAGCAVPSLDALKAACASAIGCHATLRQQDQTLECDTLSVISAYRVSASGFELAENCTSILWPAPGQPMSWLTRLKKFLVTSISAPGSPLIAQCKCVTEVVAQGDHFFLLDPNKSRPALAKVAAFLIDKPPYAHQSREDGLPVPVAEPQLAPALTAKHGRPAPLVACLTGMLKCHPQAQGSKRPARSAAEDVGEAHIGICVRVGPKPELA